MSEQEIGRDPVFSIHECEGKDGCIVFTRKKPPPCRASADDVIELLGDSITPHEKRVIRAVLEERHDEDDDRLVEDFHIPASALAPLLPTLTAMVKDALQEPTS